MDPLVSILIPAYNAQEFIAETIQSALAQSWKNKEIIIVDDGSSDQTLAVARQFSSSSVHVSDQPNQGAACARNKAFSLCQGQYIQWLDADDLLTPDKVAMQMQAAGLCSSKRRLFSSGWGHFFHRPRTARFIPNALWHDLSPVDWLSCKMGQHLHMQTATWLVSRELTEAVGPWDPRLSFDDDGEYFSRIIAASDGVQFVAEGKTLYRRAGSSSLSYIGQSDKKLDSLFLSMQLHVNHLRALEDSPRVRAACVRYFNFWQIYFYPQRQDILKELDEWAKQLGGRLEAPTLPWKYAWIQKTFGWPAAKKTQLIYNHWKAAALKASDKALFRLEKLKKRD